MTIFSAALLLFLVIDPIGNIPIFMSTLKGIEHQKRKMIVIRELLIALVIMILFLFFGKYILELFQITGPSLSIAGGIILFLIALKMIFPSKEGLFGSDAKGEPYIFPLAVPLIAGPSSLSTILIISNREPGRELEWLVAIFIAWFISILILLISESLMKYINKKGIIALERLMGMVLTAIAVQMFLTGIKEFVQMK